jgi:hypothetical protein
VEAYPGAAVLAGDARAAPGLPYRPSAAHAAADVPSYWHRCHARAYQTSVTPCILGDRSGRPAKTIALVGDSATGAWMIPLDAIGKARHWRIVAILHTLCTWTAAYVEHPLIGPHPYTACHRWGANVERRLLSLRPDAVVSSDRPVVHTPRYPSGGPGAITEVGRGLGRYWARLLAHRIPVIAIRETPEPGFDEPQCLRSHGIRWCSVPRRTAIAKRTPVTVAESYVHRRASLIDLNRYICAARCSPVVGNVDVYRDKHHVTRTYALTLAPYLERALLAVRALANG